MDKSKKLTVYNEDILEAAECAVITNIKRKCNGKYDDIIDLLAKLTEEYACRLDDLSSIYKCEREDILALASFILIRNTANFITIRERNEE